MPHRGKVKDLSHSIDSDLDFDLQGKADISCSKGGCDVTVTVTSSVTPGSSDEKIDGGQVTADLTATIQIDGESTDGCASSGSLELNGTGELACSDPGAGGVFAEVKAEKEAAAEQESEDEDGAEVPYSVPYSAMTYVYATAQVDVSQLVDEEQQEQQDAKDQFGDCPNDVADRGTVRPTGPVLLAYLAASGTHGWQTGFVTHEGTGLRGAVVLAAKGGQCSPLPTQKRRGKTQRLTKDQATELAKYLGYRPTNSVMKGQTVFTNGKTYIVQDVDSHNGGTWKIAGSVKDLANKTTRTATTDALLTEIGG